MHRIFRCLTLGSLLFSAWTPLSFSGATSCSDLLHIPIEDIERANRQFQEEFTSGSVKAVPFIGYPEEPQVGGGSPQSHPFLGLLNEKSEYVRANPLVLSTESGKEELSIVRISVAEGWRLDTLRQYGLVLEKIPGLELWVTYPPSIASTVQSIIDRFPKQVRRRITSLEVPEINGKHVWTQDGSKPLVSSKPSTVEPGHSILPEYSQTIEAFEKAGKLKSHQSIFHFEGGNVIVGERHVFVGSADIGRNMNLYSLSRPDAIKAMSAEFGKPVFEVGVRWQFGESKPLPGPIQIDFHIDLSMAVVFDRVKQKEVVFVDSGELLLKKLLETSSTQKITPAEKKYFQLFKDDLFEKREIARREIALNSLAQSLEKAGYEVVRIPGYNSNSGNLLNFTNCIFSGSNAIVPETGIRFLDQEFQDLVKTMGYDPIPMKVVQSSAQERGGIRCLTETYRRSSVRLDTPRCLLY